MLRTVSVVLGWIMLLAADGRADVPMADFGGGFDPAGLERRDVTVSVLPAAAGAPAVLRIASGHAQPWPGITIKPTSGHWDLTLADEVALDVHNPGVHPVLLGVRIDNPGGDGGKNCAQQVFEIAPGERRTVSVRLLRRVPAELGLFGMNGYPGAGSAGWGSQPVDPANLIQALIFIDHPAENCIIEISSLRGRGTPPPAVKAEGFFPFIDRFGQYRHAEWPGKLKADEDFAARAVAEQADLAGHPAPRDRDRWGGWAGGPKLAATGFFHTAKRDGRWWLVDPDGRLFWSWGVDCVGSWDGGPIEDRDQWYEPLPLSDTRFAECAYQGASRADDRYKGRQVRYFDFAKANRIRKFGKDWATAAGDLAHRRLASWGFNSIGAWSEDGIYLKRRTPYTAIIHFGGRDLAASEGYWAKFRDVFDPGFRTALRAALAGHKDTTAEDPWCLGYFVDNELSWGNETDLGTWTLASPADQPAKRVFVEELRKTYGEIAKLNAAWSTTHTGWDALLACRIPPDHAKAASDLKAFTSRTALTYFTTCREEVKRIAPHHLYLGCRFAWVNDLAIRDAARNCDVISFNKYEHSVESFRLPEGIDLPALIGEFHFGALDRGLFHTGLVPVANQAERAAAMQTYIEGALRNPALVGAHWFQYLDEPTTGRFDGENYQIGMVDICDTPYPETVAAARTLGGELYTVRTAAR